MDKLISKQYDKHKLDSINRSVVTQWEKLFILLGLENYYNSNSCILSTCQIHGGDNSTGLNIYLNEHNDYPPGMWMCQTQQCHNIFGKDMIGLTRGMLSRQKLGWSSQGDKTVSFQHTIDYLLNFLKTDYVSLQTSGQNSNQIFTNQVTNIFARPTIESSSRITREQIRKSLDIPAQYYINRGYSSTILASYDVGLCTNPKRPMFNRVVVPIYDQDYNYIGCTGRSIYKKCEECGQYHNSKKECGKRKSKWLHSRGFKRSEYLYNYCNAKKYISKSQIVIIVEGVGDVWKLEQCGIHNSIAVFGTSLSIGQFNLLNRSGALSLIVLLDNDEAGNTGMKKIQQQCGRLYRLYYPTIKENDVGDMGIDQITNDIRPLIEKIQKEII